MTKASSCARASLCSIDSLGAFRIVDFNTFDIVNVEPPGWRRDVDDGSPKVDAMTAAMARDLDPDVDVKTSPKRIEATNPVKSLDGMRLQGESAVVRVRRPPDHVCCLRRPWRSGHHRGAAGHEHRHDQSSARADELRAAPLLLGGGPGDAKAAQPAGLDAQTLAEPSTVNLTEKRGMPNAIGCRRGAGVAAADALRVMPGRGLLQTARRRSCPVAVGRRR